jgi:hypothetical protein
MQKDVLENTIFGNVTATDNGETIVPEWCTTARVTKMGQSFKNSHF